MTTITEATTDPRLFGPVVQRSSDVVRVVCVPRRACSLLPMTAEQFANLSGFAPAVPSPPTNGGNRGLADLRPLCWQVFRARACWLCSSPASKITARASRAANVALCLLIAVDRRQARTIFRYISALLLDVPMLKRYGPARNGRRL